MVIFSALNIFLKTFCTSGHRSVPLTCDNAVLFNIESTNQMNSMTLVHLPTLLKLDRSVFEECHLSKDNGCKQVFWYLFNCKAYNLMNVQL